MATTTSGGAARRVSTVETLVVGLVAWAAIHVVRIVLASSSSGGVLLQALAAELGAGRAGVAWSEERGSDTRALLRRIGLGTAGGVIVAAIAVAIASFVRHAPPAFASSSIPGIAITVVVSAAAAVRDELILRGVPLRAFAGKIPFVALIAIAAVVAAVADPEATTPAALALRAASGVAGAAIWTLDRGAFAACGANAGFHATLLFAGATDLERSWVAAGVACVAAVAVAARAQRAPSASPSPSANVSGQ